METGIYIAAWTINLNYEIGRLGCQGGIDTRLKEESRNRIDPAIKN
jgi:hypothetical protein